MTKGARIFTLIYVVRFDLDGYVKLAALNYQSRKLRVMFSFIVTNVFFIVRFAENVVEKWMFSCLSD